MERYSNHLHLQYHFEGNHCGYVDYMQWPWIERLVGFTELGIFSTIPELAITPVQYPNLTAYIQRMSGRPEVRACHLDPELQLGFIQSLLSGQPNYDLGLPQAKSNL